MNKIGHRLSERIIKACDIRGIVDKDLDERDAYFIGRSFGSYLLENDQSSCSVGRDGRISSSDYSRQLIKGLTESGIDVVDIGLVPVGTVYFSLDYLNVPASVMVTASHNPADYNGFKFISDNKPFHGDQLRRLREICSSGEFSSGKGRSVARDIRTEYLRSLHSFLEPGSAYAPTIVWDPGNGAVASVLSGFTETLPGRHILLCDKVDGRFPFHHPDPSVEKNVEMLKDRVLEEGADLGIAFDGDGDRMAVVDGEGRLFYGDQLLILLARNVLEQHPGAVIMSEVKASRFFSDEVRRLGGRPLLWKVGHTNQKEKMIEQDIPLAGETSGHFYFRENGNFDDALFTAVKLLQQLRAHPDSIVDLKERFPLYHDSGEIRINLNDRKPEAVLEGIGASLKESGADYSEIDGIRRETESGFWIIRKSNTEPHLTFRCEDSSLESYERSLRWIQDQLERSGLFLPV
jgi:phosphomannomutase